MAVGGRWKLADKEVQFVRGIPEVLNHRSMVRECTSDQDDFIAWEAAHWLPTVVPNENTKPPFSGAALGAVRLSIDPFLRVSSVLHCYRLLFVSALSCVSTMNKKTHVVSVWKMGE